MATLESTETLADAPCQTLETPAAAPNPSSPEPRVSEPGQNQDDQEANHFAVGDFVWSKIKNHPWWPGQVYDPSQSLDHARSAHRKNHCLLVAYFGDDRFSWCDPAQLKPFTASKFREMEKQSSAKSFMAAVGGALNAIGRRLESDLTCGCIAETSVLVNANLSFTNYEPEEFLEVLCGVARDALSVDMLEATRLCSWASALGKGSFSSGEFAYHPRREVADLVDRIDLDALSIDLFGEELGQDELWSNGREDVKKPEISEEKLYRSRKKRSVAELIEEMDLDSISDDDDDEEEEEEEEEEEKVEEVTLSKPLTSKRKKKGKSKKVMESIDVQSDNARTDEDTGSGMGRRERKKSKYLSPPYTHMSKFSGSSQSTEPRTPKKASGASWPLLLDSPKISNHEEDMKSPVFKIESTPAGEILSEFLITALNPLHLKWNRSAKTVIGFFAIYRSSMYSNGSGFDAYKEHLGSCGNLDDKFADKVMADKPENRRLDGRKRRKSGINDKTPSDLGDSTPDHSEQVKTRSNRKTRKQGDDGMSPLKLSQEAMDQSEQGKTGSERKMRKHGAPKQTSLVLVPDATSNGFERGKTGRRGRPRKDSNKVQALADLNIKIAEPPEGRKTPRKRSKIKDETVSETKVDLGHDPINSAVSNKKALTEIGALLVPNPPLPQIRKSLERMISTLTEPSSPEKDAGTSDGLKPEVRENLVGEMRGLLKKVNKMLNVPAVGVS